jgi:short-subunit dehydrogenase
MRDLRGSNAILTGGSRGIGPYIARALAKQGVNLALAARDAIALERIRAEIEALGVRAIAVAADVCQTADRSRLVERATDQLGPVDVLVNNAGIEPTGELVALDPEVIENAIATNLTAAIQLTRRVLPAMLERRRGHIVNVASLAGKVPIAYDSIYSATKFALVGFSHAVRDELRGTGVGMSVVCPGFVSEVGMFADAVAEAGVRAPAIAGTSTPEQVAGGVVRAIRHDVAEVIVTPVSGRPLVAASQLSPAAGMRIMRQIGITELFRAVGKARTAGAGSRAREPLPDRAP